MKINKWWRRIYPATKTDHEAFTSKLNQIRLTLDQTKQMVEMRNAMDNSIFLSVDLQNKIRLLLRLLQPVKINGFDKIRVGSEADGGYIQLDDYKRLSLALSVGIGSNDDWDLATAKNKVPVKQFDHTIDHAPSNHSLLEFNCKKISGVRCSDTVTLSELVAEHPDRSYPNIILKIDIEGDEWDLFDHTDNESFSRFAQIICEFHNLHKLYDPQHYDTAFRVFKKLNAAFVVFHVHANNYGSIVNVGNVAIPQTLEVSFANRSCYSFKDAHESFPTSIDRPNNPDVADIYLGNFCF